MENTNELYKTLRKRNFYTLKDSSNVFFYALILPIAVSFLFVFIAMTVVSSKHTFEDSNALQAYLNGCLWFVIIGTMITQIVFLCLYFAYNKASRIKQSSCNLSFKKANIWTSLLSCLLGILFVLLFVWLIDGAFGDMFAAFGIKDTPINLPLDNVGWLFLSFLLLGVLPAVTEELIFRGIIFQGLKSKYSVGASILLSALFFALIHQNILQFIYPFILGCVLAIVMHRTNNLLYPILIHLFNNLTTILLQFLSNINAINLDFKHTWYFYVIAVLLATVMCVLFWLFDRFYLRKQQKVKVEKEGESLQTPPLAIKGFPLMMIISMIICVVLIVINALPSK